MVDGFITEYANINRGVPHGTVIGPFLFSLMVEGIKPKQPEFNRLIKFADDMTVSAPVRSDKDSSMEEVKHIENWAARISGGTFKPPPGPINGIKSKKWLKLLGVAFEDAVCCWELQVDDLLSKAGSRMYILRVCKRYGYQKEHLCYMSLTRLFYRFFFVRY